MNRRRVRLRLLRVGHCRHPEWITLRGGRFAMASFPSLCALIIHPDEGAILYDTGYAEHFEAATARLPERFYRWITPVQLSPDEQLIVQLGRIGVAAGDVRHVLVSHFHADHIAGLRDFPTARIHAFRADADQALSHRGFAGLRRALLPALLPADLPQRLQIADDASAVALPDEFAPFRHGHDLFGDLSVIALSLPGHTPGHMGLLLRNEDDRHYFLIADACWSARAYREQRLPSLVARWLMHDWRSYRNTLSQLGRFAAARPEFCLLPSHCEASWQALPDNARLAPA